MDKMEKSLLNWSPPENVYKIFLFLGILKKAYYMQGLFWLESTLLVFFKKKIQTWTQLTKVKQFAEIFAGKVILNECKFERTHTF